MIDPRLTRTAAHATEYVRIRSGTDIPVIWGLRKGMCSENGWEDKEFIRQRVYGMDDIRKEVGKMDAGRGRTRLRRSRRAARAGCKNVCDREASDADLGVWAQPSIRSVLPTCARSASPCSRPATSASSAPAPIFSTATPMFRRATDLGLDIVTLPLYYGLAEGAWASLVSRLGCRLRVDAGPV